MNDTVWHSHTSSAKTMAANSTGNSSAISAVITLQALIRGYLVRKKMREAAILYRDIVETIEGGDAVRKLQWSPGGISVPIHHFKEPESVLLLRKLTQRTVSGTRSTDAARSPLDSETGTNSAATAPFEATVSYSLDLVTASNRDVTETRVPPPHSEAEPSQSGGLNVPCAISGTCPLQVGEDVQADLTEGADEESNTSESMQHHNEVQHENSSRSSSVVEDPQERAQRSKPDSLLLVDDRHGGRSGWPSVTMSATDDEGARLSAETSDQGYSVGLCEDEDANERLVHRSSTPDVGKDTPCGFDRALAGLPPSENHPGENNDQRSENLANANNPSDRCRQQSRNGDRDRAVGETRVESDSNLVQVNNGNTDGTPVQKRLSENAEAISDGGRIDDGEGGQTRVHTGASMLVCHGPERHEPIDYSRDNLSLESQSSAHEGSEYSGRRTNCSSFWPEGQTPVDNSKDILSPESQSSAHDGREERERRTNEDKRRPIRNSSGGGYMVDALPLRACINSDEGQTTGGGVSGYSTDRGTSSRGVPGNPEDGTCSDIPAVEAQQDSGRSGDAPGITALGRCGNMVHETPSPPSQIHEHRKKREGPVRLSKSSAASSASLESLRARIQTTTAAEADLDDGDITKVTALSSWDDTSVWDSEDGSVLDLSSVHQSPEQLQTMRKNIAMELMWVEQAIQSRKAYLRLKSDLGRDTNEDRQVP